MSRRGLCFIMEPTETDNRFMMMRSVDGGRSWHCVYNYVPCDRLKGWQNFNLSLWVEGPDNLRIEAYVKNLLDSTPITDAFLNSDDSGLTTNVFTLDPRIIGFSVSKTF